MKIKKYKVFFIGLFLYLAVIIINQIALNNPSVYFGKDDGILFRVFFTCLASAFIFFFLKSKISFFLIGFLLGICCFIATALIIIGLSEVIENDNSGWNFPLVVDQLISATIILMFSIFFSRKIENNSKV